MKDRVISYADECSYRSLIQQEENRQQKIRSKRSQLRFPLMQTKNDVLWKRRNQLSKEIEILRELKSKLFTESSIQLQEQIIKTARLELLRLRMDKYK